eukprot:9476570-Pyramimonas_sp.AAC.2
MQADDLEGAVYYLSFSCAAVPTEPHYFAVRGNCYTKLVRSPLGVRALVRIQVKCTHGLVVIPSSALIQGRTNSRCLSGR